MRPRSLLLAALVVSLCGLALAACLTLPRGGPGAMPDLSGLAWLDGDLFVAVHDAKRLGEGARVRASLVRLPRSEAGPTWTPLDVVWPADHGPSHDLEAITRIPGTPTFLLLESGDDATAFRRIFVADFTGGALRIRHVAGWPVPVRNVEGAAVARVGAAFVFVFAERAHGDAATRLTWMPLTLDPLAFGAPRDTLFRSPDPVGPDARPVSALDADSRGHLYAVSATDPGEAGPYRSVVWEIGIVRAGLDGRPEVALLSDPIRRATLDGLKVEGLAVREARPGAVELFVGTDDEWHGAVLRPLPPWR
jgi:hypothetical protein